MIKPPKWVFKRLFRLLGLEVYKRPAYSDNRFEWFRDYKINSILDVGANTGQSAFEFHRALPHARIHCFEPVSEAYRLLCCNTTAIPEVVSYNIALGDRNGQEKINRNRFVASSSLLEMGAIHKEAYPFTAEVSEETISVCRLDDFVAQRRMVLERDILIKIDVQGYENRVIAGGVKTLSRARIVILEANYQELYKGQATFSEIYDALINLGFSYRGALTNTLHPRSGVPLYGDVLFVKG